MTTGTLRQQFEWVLNESVRPYLLGIGYSRKSDRQFRKIEGDLEYSVSLSLLTRYRDPLAVICVCASVRFRALADFLSQRFGLQKEEALSAASCGGLILNMLPRNAPRTWARITKETDPRQSGKALLEDLDRYVFPYVKWYSDPLKAIEFWAGNVGNDVLAMCGMLHLIGRKPEAIERLDNTIKETVEENVQYPHPVLSRYIDQYRAFKKFLEPL